MIGFRGQKFDFAGEDGGWYVLISDLPALHLNMRVTAPVPHLPEITYITGISLITADADGDDHSIAISVSNPQSLDSSCPSGMSPCLADGALSVTIDGENALATPGSAVPGPGVGISAVNLPGACRSFGFEKYWERKMLDGIRVGQASSYESQNLAEPSADYTGATADQGMSEWVLGDPTAANMMECAAYVSQSIGADGGLFAHQSEHASFKVSTPTATVRVSHGRQHQVAMRDPTDRYELPAHLTWQMNIAIDQNDISRKASGILGETFVPTVDASGKAIMKGMEAIRGTQESCEYFPRSFTNVDPASADIKSTVRNTLCGPLRFATRYPSRVSVSLYALSSYHPPQRVHVARCSMPPSYVRGAGMPSTQVLRDIPFTSLEYSTKDSQSHSSTK